VCVCVCVCVCVVCVQKLSCDFEISIEVLSIMLQSFIRVKTHILIICYYVLLNKSVYDNRNYVFMLNNF
jgi:hypothetical protein